ncbi:MAG: type VI secretion system protein TssA [Plesiomonas shigelloides]
MQHSHPWCQRLLTPLPDEAMRCAVAADDPLWESVETELVKLGSLAHSQVDLQKVAGACLTLLETRTKDMRVLAQLTRCLQHPAKATPFATALMLLDCWVEAYWACAWPASVMQKQRVVSQIIKRFEGVLERVCSAASNAELTQLLQLSEAFAERWNALAPDKSALLDELLAGLRRAQRQKHEQAKADAAATPAASTASSTISGQNAVSGGAASLMSASSQSAIDTSDERAWRQTQLRVAELLIEAQPSAAIGFRLRRHALWSGITAAPLVSRGHKTQLAPFSADMADEYRSALAQADLALWQKIEHSLTLAPYWFEGHYLSAQVALKLGYTAVANAIADEVGTFLARLPTLREMTFSDGTPFLSAECSQWLQPAASVAGGSADLGGELQACCQTQGLSGALSMLDEKVRQLKEPRSRFYHQLAGADLLAAEGMPHLAAQQYQSLWQETQRLGLAQWEPGLVNRLARYATPRSA